MDQPLSTDTACRDPRRSGQALRPLSRRVLAEAGPGSTYPTEFVQALTEAGYLAALIPEEYGGAGLPLSAAAAILETIHAEGCNGAACHAQMYIMGTILRHGSTRQKQQYLPKIATGELRLQAFGVTEPTSGTDTTSLRTFAKREGDHYVVNGQKVWTSRAEHSDLMLLLARTTPRDQAKRRTDGLSTFIVDMRASRRQRHDDPADPHHDEPQLDRDLLRQHGGSGGEPDRRGRPRVPLHHRRHERRAPADLGGMHRRCALVPEEGHRLRARPQRVRPADRAEPGHPVPARQGLCADARRRTDDPRGLRQVRGRPARRARRPTWPSCSAPTPPGRRPRPACRRMAGSASPRNTTSSASIRETRLYQVAPISTNLILSYIAEHVLGLPRSY